MVPATIVKFILVMETISRGDMVGLAGNSQTYQNINQSAEKGTALLVTIQCIYQVVVVGIVNLVNLAILNPPKKKLHVLNANMIQFQISIKLNVCHLYINTSESHTHKGLWLLFFRYWNVLTLHVFLQCFYIIRILLSSNHRISFFQSFTYLSIQY